MPVINRVADLADEVTAWRRDFHEHPELLYEVHRTAGAVADRLSAFGVDEVATGIGRTGVVGVIKGRSDRSGKVIGLRADMDALPIEEATDVPYKSRTPGIMHACGHDGHTAMLLGAAKYLAETRNFDGTAVVIFQPAEEGGAGARAMLDDGVLDRFGVQEVYGLHNMPGIPVGAFAIRPGPMMAAADRFTIHLEGKGGHAARPHECVDTVVVAAHLDPGAPDGGGAQRRPARIRRDLDLLRQDGRHVQRHPSDRDPARNGPNPDRGRARPLRGAHPRDRPNPAAGVRGHGHDRVQPRLPGHPQRPGADPVPGGGGGRRRIARSTRASRR